MIGQTLGHYRILEKIGQGGMGVVYRARDERLDRDVALKALPAGALADENTRKRFRREALALAKLNHPNIAAVYDFDSQEGVDFLAMEYVSGQSLAERLRGGSLGEKEISVLGGQIAAALEEAHEQGIIHRDLKPGNVMLTPKGQAKVLDFGLAKLLRLPGQSEATQTLTETQGVAGTLPYMAPEQLRGEALDSRTDIYALGCVLYEMATGQRAFQEDSAPQLTDAILHRPPVTPRALNARISPALEHIIVKCLEKEGEERYQSAKEVMVDLRRRSAPSAVAAATVQRPAAGWRRYALPAAGILIILLGGVVIGLNVGGWRDRVLGRAGPAQIRSLAVLPLENLSHDPEQEYFADGMTDQLITDLAQIGAFRVISRTSAMQYKGAKKSLPEIAQKLGVDAVVQGSVERSGERVRITAQLIYAPTDTHLWANSYDRTLGDVLILQDEVARAIADEVSAKLSSGQKARLSQARAVNVAAYDSYLRGRYFWRKLSAAGLPRAIEYFQQAIEQDPNYALAYAGLADSYALGSVAGGAISPQEGMPKAREAATRALQLDGGLAEAHLSLALVKTFYDWDWAGADKEFSRAIELNPNYAEAHHWYSHYFLAVGRAEESLAESKRALELDPLSFDLIWHLGFHYHLARQDDQAIAQLKRLLELDPSSALAHYWLGMAYEQRELLPQAIKEFQEVRALLPNIPFGLPDLAHAYAVSGQRSEAVKILNGLIELSNHRYVAANYRAIIYVGLGDRDQAFAWLQKTCDEHSFYVSFLKTDPRLDGLRADPRFQDLLRRVGLPQ